MSFKIKAIISLLMILPYIVSVPNGRCGGSGICLTVARCNANGGFTRNGLCPFDPENVKCCFSMNCRPGNGINGVCKFVNDCKKRVYAGLCPGGADFRCCAWVGSLSFIQIKN